EHAPAVPPHRGFREKFLIPLAIPIGCFVAAAIVIFCISQILLAVPGKASTPIALLIAIGILLLCAYLATTPRLTRQTLFSIVGTSFALVVVFGIVGGVYRLENPEKPGGEAGAKAASAPGGNLSPSPANEVTTDNKFS